MSRESRRELWVFCLLTAIAVAGRWFEPAWNFTPLAAITALGGYYFRSWLPAILLPWTVLTLSDAALLPHDNFWVPASVYAMSLLPVALGRAARGREGWRRAVYCGLCGFVPATAFFVVTNFAVWATRSLYAPTLAGLADCYDRALPFYRVMLEGDVCYVSLMAACVALSQVLERRAVEARA